MAVTPSVTKSTSNNATTQAALAKTLSDQDSAARLVEVIKDTALSVVNAQIPPSKFALVTAVDFANHTATCVYPEEPLNPFVVPTTMSAPSGPGCIVRIAGPSGARYVSEVILGGISLLQGSEVAGRRLNLNGEMQVHQMGTSATGLGTAGISSITDGFLISANWSGASVTETNYDTATGDSLGGYWPDATLEHSNLLVLNAAQHATFSSGEYFALETRIEARNLRGWKIGTAKAKTVTVSFVMLASYDTTIAVELYRHTAAGTRAISRLVNITGGIRKQYSVTFPADTSGVLTPNDSSTGLTVFFWLAAGSTFTSGTLQTSWGTLTSANRAAGITNAISHSGTIQIDFTGIQVEYGDIATQFEHKRFEAELLSCKRFRRRDNCPPLRGIRSASGANPTIGRMAMPLSPEMRASPTIVVGALPAYDGIAIGTVTGISANYSSATKVEADLTSNIGAGGVAGTAVLVYESGTAYMDLLAELP